LTTEHTIAFHGPRPAIVVLCGSTRFKAEFGRANHALTEAGCIVLAPGVFGHADGITLTDDVKAKLDALHLRKIDLAGEVMVVSDATGYVGHSTLREMEYADKTRKEITHWCDVCRDLGHHDGTPHPLPFTHPAYNARFDAHVITRTPGEDPGLPGLDAVAWECSCGDKSPRPLAPPTTERRIREHLTGVGATPTAGEEESR
jgi:hypothetical protein